jgi:hypothetical protein
MVIKNLFIFVCFFACLNMPAYAFQYEDYAWGLAQEKIKAIVQKKHKNIVISQIEKTINYKDDIFDSLCEVTLLFTPKSEVLYLVKILWKNPETGEKVRNALAARYGEPLKADAEFERYAWFGQNEGEIISLDYSGKTTELIFSVPDAYPTKEKDSKVNPVEEIVRF